MPTPPPGPELPAILEIKRTLAGREKRFDCRLLARSGDGRHAAVLWVGAEPMQVHGVDLPAGTVSVGHFWSDRHYNVYHWLEPAGKTLGYYFNIFLSPLDEIFPALALRTTRTIEESRWPKPEWIASGWIVKVKKRDRVDA